MDTKLDGYTMLNLEQLSEDYWLVERAIRFLEENAHRQPTLKEVADYVGMSEFHFQRVFSRWAGISPKRFLQFLTKERAKAVLERSGSMLEAAYSSGLSGPGRLHDLFVTCEAVTPGEYKSGGAGLQIFYGFHPTPFGESLIAITGRGICGLSFTAPEGRQAALDRLQSQWEQAGLVEDPQATRPFIHQAFQFLSGQPTGQLHLILNGTNFQIKVWEALLRVPSGSLVTYGQLAAQSGYPGAARAVGSAVAHNPVALIIPCHRVIRSLGEFGQYRWGTARKKAIFAWEQGQYESLGQ